MGEKVGSNKPWRVKIYSLSAERDSYGALVYQYAFKVDDLSTRVVLDEFRRSNPEPGEYILVGEGPQGACSVVKAIAKIPTVEVVAG